MAALSDGPKIDHEITSHIVSVVECALQINFGCLTAKFEIKEAEEEVEDA